MTRYTDLMTRIAAGEKVLIDGATGSELEVRGVGREKNAWTALGAETHPDILKEIHADYIKLGARVVISNTFATARHTLRDGGMEEKFEFLNRRGMELVVEARDAAGELGKDVVAAGGLSYWSFANNHPSLETLASGLREQAAILAKAGAELLILEMMVDIDRMLTTLAAARTVGLPVWVGFSVRQDEDGVVRLWNGEPLADAIDALNALKEPVPLINIMHSEVRYIDAALDVARNKWEGPIGIYAHSDVPTGFLYDPARVVQPDEYAVCCDRWLGKDVQVIGACCGLGPAHIEALRPVVGA